MKKNIFRALSLALVISLTSCTVEIREDNDLPVNPTNPTNPTITTLEGDITGNLSLPKGNYTIKGVVRVLDGATLTIAAGSNFTATTSQVSGLVVLKGGKINAIGTASEPIVFTSEGKKPGDWGGLTLYGNAPIKAAGGAATALSEDGNNQIYGGNDAGHSSGILKYVRVEYGGRKIGDGSSETNSMTFYAVGAGTTLDHLVTYMGTDDGYEFFGGTVSATNLVSYGNFDDSFDWQDAWSGQFNSNWYAYQTGTGNFGMEIESSANADNTAPKVNGITLIREAGTKPETAGSSEITAIQFKKQGSGIFSNVYIDGYKNGFKADGTTVQKSWAVLIQDAATEADQLNKGKIKVSPINHVNSDNVGLYGYGFTSASPVAFTNDTAVKKVTMESGAWATVNGKDLLAGLK